jgi:hypothetical protein
VTASDALRLPRIPGRVVRREIVRMLCAFALYLALGAAWDRAGGEAAYSAAVVAVASAVFLPTQHFPVIPTLDTLTVDKLDHLAVFTFCLFLVSWSIPWRRRIVLFALAGAFVFAGHVLCFLLDVKVHSAQELYNQHKLLVLLPLEFWVVERLKYLFYDVGTEAGPMAMILVATFWNVQSQRVVPSPPARSRAYRLRPDPAPRARRGTAWIVAGSVAALVTAVFAWRSWRESRPLHVAAHARLGQLYLSNGSERGAMQQFRIAVAHGTSDPAVFLDLAKLEAKHGDSGEARRLLEHGLSSTQDPTWAAQLSAALEGTRAGSAR